MVTEVHRKAADLILSAMWQTPGSGFPSAFPIQKPGRVQGLGGISTTVYFSRRELIRACLFIRKNGPAFLGYISVSDVWSMVTKFVTTSYWSISDETFLAQYEHSYANNLSDEGKIRFTELLAASPVFTPVNELTLFPLVPVTVASAFTSPMFFLAGPEALASEIPPSMHRHLLPDQFPPFAKTQMKVESTTSWLGIRSPNRHVASKMRSVVLGALALTPNYRDRHVFTMRHMFGGTCTLVNGVTVSSGRQHTPAMADNINVTADDHPWLSQLAAMLAATARTIRRQRHALEYFYRSWPLPDSDRFPVLCMALDALFGDANQATQAVIDGVRTTVGPHINEERLRLLMKLRASVVHGGAPDVYDSSKYARYYDLYAADPIRDLELVLVVCLRKIVFEDRLRERSDPHAALLEKLKAQKRLPDDMEGRDILSTSEGETPASPALSPFTETSAS